MRAAINDECGNAKLLCPRGQKRRTKIKGGAGKTMRRINADNAGAIIFKERLRCRFNLAGADRAQTTLNTIDAMRFAGVALT